MPERKMNCYEFGRKLIETKDLDPIYVLVWESQLDEKEMQRWLLSYWCFYNVGTACWIADAKGDFWEKMSVAAASKDYPRCHERRHFRGAVAIKAVEELRKRGLAALFDDCIQAAPNAANIMDVVRRWYLFGPWIAFKAADMLERLNVCPVEFETRTAFYDGSPTEGAQVLWRTENCEADEPIWDASAKQQVTEWAAAHILNELGDLKAPPRYERTINVQEAETICCKHVSYLNGRYHIGEDVEACRKGLAWASTRRSLFSQRMYRAGKVGGIF